MSNEIYSFKLGKDEQGQPTVTHSQRTSQEFGTQILDTLEIDPSITIEPTQASFDFMESLLDKLHAYLVDGKLGSPMQFRVIEFPETEDNSILQDCVEEFIALTINEGARLDDLKYHIHTRLFVIDTTTWVVSKGEQPDCSEFLILDAARYPIVKVAEKIATLWPTHNAFLSTESDRRESMSHERWVDFDFLNIHFPIFS